MRIANVGLIVNDIEAARAFFEGYFGAEVHARYDVEATGYRSYIMRLDEGAKIELISKPTVRDVEKTTDDAGWVHICVKVESEERFEEILAKAKADGYEILYEPATVGGKEFRAVMFEDNIFEVCW